MTSQINAESQSLQPSATISLFVLDTSFLGGPLLYFVQGSEHRGNVRFGGIEYVAMDVEFSGLEVSGAGGLPTPKIRLANTDGLIQAIINTWGDLVGCTLHRVRTFERFLDGRPDADPEAFYGPDTFRIERKALETQPFIEWDLSAAIDQEGKQIPGRQVIRDTCLWRYRIWNENTHAFDYAKAQCPYAGLQSYDINDQPISDPSKDVPSRRLSCCRARFGAGNPLPFGGFPGVARTS
ncbi:phage minor tail protein L [Ancylobacter rudongensis]|uniref:Lambda-like phage minor tail protein L n=1 Tax=Ancylobacter rudongensis TaxID=177413 RepID=A0A1G4UQ47_9HYPH|nr:phage minor tail protein L [Ancylobacter rudongensis]SCW95667.1 lambda-like phage minor tail protein L [Ancylobacter rudongensis]